MGIKARAIFVMVQFKKRSEMSRWPRSAGPVMAHEIAKLLLEHANTFLERTEAVKSALALGMPLNEIEEYLDWVDLIRSQPSRREPPNAEPPQSGPTG